jgi:tRNA threonylcarbamoyladenosine biosynthesis protein TsaB
VAGNFGVLNKAVIGPHREHVERLAPAVVALLKETGIRSTELSGFSVALGPGSFSGTRVGLSMGKAMATVLNKPVVGVSSLDIIAWDVLKPGQKGLALISAGRRQFYWSLYSYGEDFQILEGPGLVEVSGLASLLETFDRPRALVSEDDWTLLDSSLPVDCVSLVKVPSPESCAVMGIGLMEKGLTRGVHSLEPIYVRASDAEEKRLHK